MLAAVAVRVILSPLIGEAGTFLPFVLAVTLAAFLGGRAPALAAFAASLVAVTVVLLPVTSTEGEIIAWLVYVALFSAVALLVAQTVHYLQGNVEMLRESLERAEKSERALRISEERFQHMADHAPVLIWRTDAENRGIWFNRPWLEFTGRTLAAELSHEWASGVHAEDRERAIAHRQAHLDRREPFMMEFRMRRGDGVYRWVVDRGVPMFDGPDESFSGYLGSCLDITERHESEERLRAILDRASAVVFMKDREGHYLQVNEEFLRIFGLTREAIVGRSEAALFPNAVSGQLREHDRNVWQTQQPLTAEETVPCLAGPRTYITTKFLLRDANGSPYALCGIATDITARKEMEQALHEADRRKDVFLATLSHELRNPLAPIRQSVKLLERLDLGAPDAIRAREIIDRQSRNMALLLDDLLDISRITRGKLSLRKEHIELASVIDAAREIARPLLDERRHQLDVHLPESAVFIEADHLRLAQVVANLLTNAAKYTEPGGRISVRVVLEGDAVAVHVRDNGIGISPEMLPRVFQMFTQGLPITDHTPTGLGIGLALVRGLLDLHGGTIEARSAGIGAGSEFIVRLPIGNVSAGNAATPVSQQPLPSPADLPGCRVLLADDNRDAALSLEILLSGDGYEVRTVHDGRMAVEAANAFRPDVAILDIGMPELTGLQVAEHIRAQAWGREMYLIALTGWGQAEDRQRALSAGFNKHLTKPVDPEFLQTLLGVERLTSVASKR